MERGYRHTGAEVFNSEIYWRTDWPMIIYAGLMSVPMVTLPFVMAPGVDNGELVLLALMVLVNLGAWYAAIRSMVNRTSVRIESGRLLSSSGPLWGGHRRVELELELVESFEVVKEYRHKNPLSFYQCIAVTNEKRIVVGRCFAEDDATILRDKLSRRLARKADVSA